MLELGTEVYGRAHGLLGLSQICIVWTELIQSVFPCHHDGTNRHQLENHILINLQLYIDSVTSHLLESAKALFCFHTHHIGDFGGS